MPEATSGGERLPGYTIGIDFGTSNTVGVLRRPDGRTEMLLFDGSPALLSGVCLDESGQFLTGRDAAHVARSRPDSFEPNPKRRINDGTVLLGGRDIPVPQLMAAVLSRVITEAARATGRPPERVVLTHPVAWGPRRLETLKQAAALAGITAPILVPEPVAAAFSFLAMPQMNLLPGQSVVVYDFGGGTFDATVVRRSPTGFDVAAYDGLDDLGGLDIDAAIVNYFESTVGPGAPEVWGRLTAPGSATDRRAARLLWDDVRQAKETLSRTSSVSIYVPLLDRDLPLGREHLEALARPLLYQTISTTQAAIRTAATPQGSIAAVFLVGGSSRFPLAATLVHQHLGIAPTVVENPELIVAQGAILVAEAFSRPIPPPSPFAQPLTPPQAGGVPHSPPTEAPAPGSPAYGAAAHGALGRGTPPPAPKRTGRRLVIGIAAAMAAVVFLVCGGVVASHALSSDNSDGDTYYDAATASPTAEPSPTGPPCPQRLAYLGAVTGAGRDLGKRVQNGAQLAVQQYNAAHSGCDVVLKTYDTGSNAAKAGKLSATIAADTTTVGVIGPVSPDEVSAAGGAEDKVGLPLISPVGDAVGLSNWQAYHQVIGDENSPALFTRNYFVNVLKSQRIFLVDDGSKPATALSGIIRNDLGELAVGDETVKSDAASTQSLADRIRTSDATVVFYAGAPASGGRLRKALTDDGGRNVTMVGTPQLDAPVFFAQAGAAAEGTTLLGPYLPPADAPAAFVTAYKQAYKAAPPRYAAEAYDAAKVFIDGIAAGKTDRKQMTDFLTTYSAQGLTKQIKFNDLGDIDTPVMWLYQATDGAFVSKGKLATS